MSLNPEVAGIDLALMQDTVAECMPAYTKLSHGTVMIDPNQAADLALTLDKPNSARSVTPVFFRGEQLPDTYAYTIVFGPHDGTGDESTYQLSDIDTGVHYPHAPKVVPRSKAAVDSEVHLTIASIDTEKSCNRPHTVAPFAGSLSLLGLTPAMQLRKIGVLGQRPGVLTDVFDADYHEYRYQAEPTTTITTAAAADRQIGPRFGDPHAVFNPRRTIVQIATFIGLPANCPPHNRQALMFLGADAHSLNIRNSVN